MSIKATVNPTDETAEITKEEQIADAREERNHPAGRPSDCCWLQNLGGVHQKRGNFPRRKGPVQLPHSPVE